MKKIRWTRTVLPIALAAGMLGGCSVGGQGAEKNAEPVSLKVMYYDERSFFDQYGMLFSAIHPEIELEVVNTQSVKYEPGKDMDAEMLKFIDEQKPDIVMLSADQYTKMAEDGKLLDIESKVTDKSFDKEGLMPGMLDYLRDLSGGKLYGLVPEFYSQAIYYNKDLFQKYGVQPPKDQMSWDELLRLAAMFPADGSKDSRVYGLKMSYQGADLFDMGTMIGMTHNLNLVDPSAKQITINTDAWKKAFETALTALNSGSLYRENPDRGGAMQYEDYLLSDPFVSGKVAMTVDGTYLMDQIKQAQNAVPDKAIKNWDLVTMPVDPANPDVSTSASFNNIFAISTKSGQTDAAWTFLKYVHSDDFARVTSKRQMGSMTVRTKYLTDKEGHHFEAYYKLKPVRSNMYSAYSKLPQAFMMQFDGVARQELAFAADGKESVSEVLESLQNKLQEALLQANSKQALADGTSTPAANG